MSEPSIYNHFCAHSLFFWLRNTPLRSIRKLRKAIKLAFSELQKAGDLYNLSAQFIAHVRKYFVILGCGLVVKIKVEGFRDLEISRHWWYLWIVCKYFKQNHLPNKMKREMQFNLRWKSCLCCPPMIKEVIFSRLLGL